MLSIVAGHWCSYANINLYDLGGVGVDVFLAISGFLCGKKRINSHKTWFKRRVFRIMIPVWIWTVILSIATIFEGAFQPSLISSFFGVNGVDFISPFYISRYSGMSHAWYITVILLCYLFASFLENHYKTVERRFPVVFLVLALAQVVLTAFGVQICYFVLFFVGYYIGRNDIRFTKKLFFGAIALCVSGGILRVLCHIFGFANRFYDMVIARWSSALIGFAALIVFGFLGVTCPKIFQIVSDWRITKYLDKISFHVYLVHYSLLHGVLSVAKIQGGFAVQFPVFLIATSILSMVLCSVDSVIRKKLLRC